MKEKHQSDQRHARRNPRQARAQLKVGLMLEAAMQLLEQGELASLTTNAVAARAGVSIGTLYQYFGDKQALLDALVERELGAMGAQVLASLRGAPPQQPGERVRRVVRAVVGAYGGRGRVHRLLMEHALTRTPGRRLSPLYAQLMALLTAEGVAGPQQPARRLTPAQAFVLTHTVGGVLRALAAGEDTPAVPKVEDALVGMVLGFMAGPSAGTQVAPH